MNLVIVRLLSYSFSTRGLGVSTTNVGFKIRIKVNNRLIIPTSVKRIYSIIFVI